MHCVSYFFIVAELRLSSHHLSHISVFTVSTFGEGFIICTSVVTTQKKDVTIWFSSCGLNSWSSSFQQYMHSFPPSTPGLHCIHQTSFCNSTIASWFAQFLWFLKSFLCWTKFYMCTVDNAGCRCTLK